MRNVLVDDDESGRVYGHNEAVPELSQRLHFLPDAIEFRVRRKFSRLLTTVCLGLAGPEIQTQGDGLIHNRTHPRFERERFSCDWVIGRPRIGYARLRCRSSEWRRWNPIAFHGNNRLVFRQAHYTCIPNRVLPDGLMLEALHHM